jgi:hypothetical protein
MNRCRLTWSLASGNIERFSGPQKVGSLLHKGFATQSAHLRHFAAMQHLDRTWGDARGVPRQLYLQKGSNKTVLTNRVEVARNCNGEVIETRCIKARARLVGEKEARPAMDVSGRSQAGARNRKRLFEEGDPRGAS